MERNIYLMSTKMDNLFNIISSNKKELLKTGIDMIYGMFGYLNTDVYNFAENNIFLSYHNNNTGEEEIIEKVFKNIYGELLIETDSSTYFLNKLEYDIVYNISSEIYEHSF